MNKTIQLNLSGIPKELLFMIDLILEKEVEEDHYGNIDWEQFIQLAFHHRLYPLLYTKLVNSGYDWIPSHIIKHLANDYRKNIFNMLHLCGVMDKLNRLLAENDIRSLFLKGPILADELYGDLSMRTCGDLDILIPFADLQKADELLVSLGYEKDGYIQTLLNDWKWRHHHFTYYHQSDGTKIEIHWRLNPAPSQEPSFEELWEQRRQTAILSYPTFYLGEKDLFFFLATHGARHAWSRLRWLLDIHQMTESNPNWDGIIKRLRELGAEYIGGQALNLSSQLFDTVIPKETESFVFHKRSIMLAQKTLFYLENMVNLHTVPLPDNISKYHGKYLFSLMSVRQKALFGLSMLHPYYTDIETLPLPKRLHFLYFPLRPFLWMWRKARKHALT